MSSVLSVSKLEEVQELLQQGKSIAEISEITFIPLRTLYYWRERGLLNWERWKRRRRPAQTEPPVSQNTAPEPNLQGSLPAAKTNLIPSETLEPKPRLQRSEEKLVSKALQTPQAKPSLQSSPAQKSIAQEPPKPYIIIQLDPEDYSLVQQAIAQGKGLADIADLIGFDVDEVRKWITKTQADYIKFEPKE